MPRDIEPHLDPIDIDDIRPTQITVGMREVNRKRENWRERSEREGIKYLENHILPAVLGPKKRFWIVDHHHLALALHREGVQKVLVTIQADLSDLSKDEFLVFMDNRNWLHPFDASGERLSARDLPKHVEDMADDPFRSLAGAVRETGGFAKDATLYSEFLWADFFRRRMKVPQTDGQFEDALKKAMHLARSEDARHLPGWIEGGH